MHIEQVICPCCNSETRVGVPSGREVVNVFTAATIFSPLLKKHNHQMLCPKCTIRVYVHFA